MDDSSPGGPFAWMAPSLVKHDKISAIEPISQSIWRIYRPGMPPFILGILGVESVTLADVNRLLSQGIAIDMVANVLVQRVEGLAASLPIVPSRHSRWPRYAHSPRTSR